ncbi:MAG TPA: cupin domain-containing protein [Pseudolabrys sp.]|nr:cupin domain-containing protein [Pseudolabrys sp.]
MLSLNLLKWATTMQSMTSRTGAAVALALSLLAIEPVVAFSTAAAQGKLVIEPVAEAKLKQLPPGPLYWRIETFATLAAARAAAGPTSLPAEVAGKVWLFTLGPKGRSSAGGSEVTEVGPIPPLAAPEYLLRINRATGPPGATTAVHSHPGSEAFYVLAGRMSQRTPHGTMDVEVGQSVPGHGADTPMQVSSSGKVDLDQLVMFVVDATRPFSSPAKFE